MLPDSRPLPAIQDQADVVVFSIEGRWYWRPWWIEDEGAAGPFASPVTAMAAARAAGKTPYLDCPF